MGGHCRLRVTQPSSLHKRRDEASGSRAVCAGSNPAEGALLTPTLTSEDSQVGVVAFFVSGHRYTPRIPRFLGGHWEELPSSAR